MNTLEIALAAGIAAERSGNHTEARTQYANAIQQDPYNVVAWLGLSRLMEPAEQALRCVEQVLHVDPQHAEALEAKSLLQMRLLVEEAAIISTPDRIPSSVQRRYLLGEALVATGVITHKQLQLALKEQARLAHKQQPQRLGEILLAMNFVQPAQLEAALVQQITNLSANISDHKLGLFGAFLVRHNFISQEQLTHGVREQAKQRDTGQHILLGEALVQCGFLSQAQLNHALLTWQQWWQRAKTTREDPYITVAAPSLRTRRQIARQPWHSLTQWFRR